jgi:hypothetical protein
MVPETFDGSSGALASAPFDDPPVPVHPGISKAAPTTMARAVRRFMCISSVQGTDEHERVGWFGTLTTFS